MAETFQTDAIVLRRNNLSEVDRFYVVYTAHLGKMSLMAKGIRKTKSKLAGHMEPGSLVRMMIARGRRSDKLAGAALSESFSHLRSSFLGMTVLQTILEFAHLVTKEQYRDVALFHKFVDGLSFFDSWFGQTLPTTQKAHLRLEIFFFHLLHHLGYRPELERCVICRKNILDSVIFDFERSGLAHAEHYPITRASDVLQTQTVQALQSLSSHLVSEDFLPLSESNALVPILQRFREHTTEAPLKSLVGLRNMV